MGFQLEPIADGAYGFRYEMSNMTISFDALDPDFLSLAAPQICEWDEDKAAELLCLIEQVNSMVKYVKAYRVNDDVWLFYEREVFEGDDLERTLVHMVLRLNAALEYARKMMEELDI